MVPLSLKIPENLRRTTQAGKFGGLRQAEAIDLSLDLRPVPEIAVP
ncbi:MAG TPA: hypothetical protein QGF05_01200 [Dehalococcoidia bacterium]|nr:hypothetical protein [Dehalococcoidia bacterium]